MASLKYWLWLSSLPKVSLRMKHVTPSRAG